MNQTVQVARNDISRSRIVELEAAAAAFAATVRGEADPAVGIVIRP